MSKKLLGENVEPRCSYCVFGTATDQGDVILCPKKGVLAPDDSCKKFAYDPLKRTPLRPKAAPEGFAKEDFYL